MVPNTKTRNPVVGVGDNRGPLGKLSHAQPLSGQRLTRLLASKGNQLTGLLMENQGKSQGLGGGLASVVVWRRTDPSKTEDQVAAGKTLF